VLGTEPVARPARRRRCPVLGIEPVARPARESAVLCWGSSRFGPCAGDRAAYGRSDPQR